MITIENIRIATDCGGAPVTVVVDGGVIVSIRDAAGAAGAAARDGNRSVPSLSRKPLLCYEADSDDTTIDGSGLWLAPGFVDLHVHFRDPGYTDKEDIASGSMAAVHCGYTTVCCMPNTSPAIDNADTVKYVDDKSRSCGRINLFAVGALTVGQRGAELADIAGMSEASTLCRSLTGRGIAGITEDGKSLMDEGLMRESMLIAKSLGLLVMDHAEDAAMTGGHINEGSVSERLGVRGLPARAEASIVERDIRLAAETGARIHIQHVSAADSVALIRAAKADGLPVTAETAPHYFTLTEDVLMELPLQHRAMAKMNPPLRTESDRIAIIEGLADGIIDCIATDHAPHEAALKELPLDEAPFGIVGLETAFAISYTELVLGGYLTLPQLIDKLSAAPAWLIGLDRGVIREGAAADLAVLDIDTEYNISSDNFASKGRNTPFEGRAVRGRVFVTIHDGDVVYLR